jgi:hypothetical protein
MAFGNSEKIHYIIDLDRLFEVDLSRLGATSIQCAGCRLRLLQNCA